MRHRDAEVHSLDPKERRDCVAIALRKERSTASRLARNLSRVHNFCIMPNKYAVLCNGVVTYGAMSDANSRAEAVKSISACHEGIRVLISR